MDFGIFPPEINSGRIYAGPGSGPMLAAAAAWDGLAVELNSAAASYGSVIAGLTGGSWLGPASESMAAAVAPYVAWLQATASQAEHAATQAKAAAAAYETAFAMHVPPPVIAANRSLLMSLVATNFLGQNSPAIAATEASYGEMWAQDAAAMYGYAASSASASTLTPFTPPKPTTNVAGMGGQAAAVARAAGTPAGTAQTMMSAMPQVLQSLASPVTAAPPAAPTAAVSLTGLNTVVAAADTLAASVAAGASSTSAPASFTSAGYSARSIPLAERGIELQEAAQHLRPPLQAASFPGLGAGLGASGAGSPVSASMARAATVGDLTVPHDWVSAAPEIRLAAAALPSTTVSAAPAALAGSSGSMFGEMALAGMAGRALGSTSTAGRPVARTDRPPAGVDGYLYPRVEGRRPVPVVIVKQPEDEEPTTGRQRSV